MSPRWQTLPPPLSPANVPLPPARTEGEGAHSPGGEGRGVGGVTIPTTGEKA
jgi:hypothetical protein